MFSSHIPRQPHQCPGKRGVAQSSAFGGREGGGFVGVSVCGHGFMWPWFFMLEAAQCSSWRFCSRTCTTKRCSRHRCVDTIGRSPLAKLIVLQVGSILFTQLTTLPGTFHGANGGMISAWNASQQSVETICLVPLMLLHGPCNTGSVGRDEVTIPTGSLGAVDSGNQ